MPWRSKPMKDVGADDMFWGAGNQAFNPELSEWGNPAGVIPRQRLLKLVGSRREPGELNHLSTRRKRKKRLCFAQAHFLSSGERKGIHPEGFILKESARS